MKHTSETSLGLFYIQYSANRSLSHTEPLSNDQLPYVRDAFFFRHRVHDDHMNQTFSSIFTDHLKSQTRSSNIDQRDSGLCKSKVSVEFGSTWQFRRTEAFKVAFPFYHFKCTWFYFIRSTSSVRYCTKKLAGFFIQACEWRSCAVFIQSQTKVLSAPELHCPRPVTVETNALFPSDTKPELKNLLSGWRLQELRGKQQ